MYGDKIYEDKYQIIYSIGDEPVLTMYWKAGTQGMNYPQFQGCLYIFSGTCVEHKTPFAIIDSSEFNAVDALLDPGTTMQDMKMDRMWQWRSEAISPVYNSAGIRKFAFTGGPEGQMFGYDEQTFPNEDFVTKVCETPESSLAWLRS